jgi:hypothetical protein
MEAAQRVEYLRFVVEVNGESRAGMHDRIGMHSNKTYVVEQEGAQSCELQ